jgi:hypothetical protein
MNIPTYANCSMCTEWCENERDWTKGTCAGAEENAREGMARAGMTPLDVSITVAWSAKPCQEGWEPTPEAQREIEAYEAEQDEPKPIPAQRDFERALGLERR